MGCVTATAKRRRRQAANGYNHLCERQRPNFKKTTAEKSARRQAALIATQRRIQQGKKK